LHLSLERDSSITHQHASITIMYHEFHLFQ
jgi:hypothetical protein